jgi:hypothetical protein
MPAAGCQRHSLIIIRTDRLRFLFDRLVVQRNRNVVVAGLSESIRLVDDWVWPGWVQLG